jgi:hypothetical protein
MEPTKRKRDEFEYYDTTQRHANQLESILEALDTNGADEAKSLVEVVAAMRDDCRGWWNALLDAHHASEKTLTQRRMLDLFSDELDFLEETVLVNYFDERGKHQKVMGAQQVDDFDFGPDEEEEESERNVPTPPPVEARALPTYKTRPSAETKSDFVLLLAAVKRYFANESYNQAGYLQSRLKRVRDDAATSIFAHSYDLRRPNGRNLYGTETSRTADIFAAFRQVVVRSLLALVQSDPRVVADGPSAVSTLDVALLLDELEAVTTLEYRYTDEELRLQKILELASDELRDSRQAAAKPQSPLVLFYTILIASAQLAMAVWRLRVKDCADGFGKHNILDVERDVVERLLAQAESETESDSD